MSKKFNKMFEKKTDSNSKANSAGTINPVNIVDSTNTASTASSISCFFKKTFSDRLLWLCLALFLLSVLLYFILGLVLEPTHTIHISLDDSVPFIPTFIIPYVLLYPFQAGAITLISLASCRDEKYRSSFKKWLIYYAVTFSISLLVLAVYPSLIEFRPPVPSKEEALWLSRTLTSFIYSVDETVNVFPSLHCVYAMVLTVGIFKLDGVSSLATASGKSLKWPIRIITLIFATLISISTIFVKQHSILDVVGAFIISYLSYIAVYATTKTNLQRQFN